MNDIAVVSIGRNIDGIPMDRWTWDEFRGETYSLVVGRPETQLISLSSGTGYWEDDTEDTYVVVFAGTQLEDLTPDLRYLAYTFKQEAVGLIVGRSSVIEASCVVTSR